MTTLHTPLPHDVRQAVRAVQADIARSAGLPNACYADAEMLQFERDSVFREHWTAVAFCHDAPDPGTVYPFQFLGFPLLLVRDRDEELRVFHNVCSHRGVKLVDHAGTCGRLIRCPYHSWGYALDGRLQSTPKIGGPQSDEHPDFDRSRHGLREIRSAKALGVVFVDFSGAAPDFDQAAEALRMRWTDFIDRPLTHVLDGVSSFELELRANWKLAVENYCESYHLPWVHPSLNTYSRLEDHYHIREDRGTFSGQGSKVYRPTLSAVGQAFPAPDDLPSQWQAQAEYIALYPNVLLGVHKDHIFAILLQPKAPDVTMERIALFYFDEAVRGDSYDELRRANAAQWRTVFAEDVDVVERMQAGRASPGFRGGVFSPAMDQPTHDFHRWVAAALLRLEAS